MTHNIRAYTFTFLFIGTAFCQATAGEDLPCFKFHGGDSAGYDIRQIAGDLKTIAEACLNDKRCLAFNPGGWLKYTLNPINQPEAPGWYEKTCLSTGSKKKCRQDYEECRDTFCGDSEDDDGFEDLWDDDSEALCKQCDLYLVGCIQGKPENPKPDKSKSKDTNSNSDNQKGRDRQGFDKFGFDKDGFNKDGFNIDGFDRNGFNRRGWNRQGFDKFGFDKDGFNKNGYNKNGQKKKTFNNSDDSPSSGAKFYRYVSEKVQRSKISKDEAQTYLEQIGSWFGLSDKDPRKLFRRLSRIAHPDQCSIPPKAANTLRERGFPNTTNSRVCDELYPIISGLYSAL